MKVKLWAEIRRLYHVEGLSQRAIAPASELLPQDRPESLGHASAARGEQSGQAWQ